jgi:hypothetical protein
MGICGSCLRSTNSAAFRTTDADDMSLPVTQSAPAGQEQRSTQFDLLPKRSRHGNPQATFGRVKDLAPRGEVSKPTSTAKVSVPRDGESDPKRLSVSSIGPAPSDVSDSSDSSVVLIDSAEGLQGRGSRIVTTKSSRPREVTQQVDRGLVGVEFGPTQSYGPCPNAKNQPICTGGTSVKAVLGPDLAETNTDRHHLHQGSSTSGNSLQPLMGLLHEKSAKPWVAGHLLNSDFGGEGDKDKNLTPLTAAANGAHKFFENHVKKILLKCRDIDIKHPELKHWYGVLYEVKVSSDPYSENRRPDDLHSYCFSNLTLTYRLITLPKSDTTGFHCDELQPGDKMSVELQKMGIELQKRVASICAASDDIQNSNIQNFKSEPGNRISVEIHNEV